MLLQVQRSTCPMRVAFVPLEANTAHWAAKLPLPANVPFEVIHKATGTVVHTGDGGPTNRMYLPSDLLFTGERYVLQSKTSSHLLAARTDFVVAPPPSQGVAATLAEGGVAAGGTAEGGASGGMDDAQEVTLPIERAVGDVRMVLRSADERPLPVKVPYIVRHKDTETPVIEGHTARRARGGVRAVVRQ